MKREQINETTVRLTLKEKEILLVGTAHISQESIDEVVKAIEDETPDTVCIELDEERFKAITERNRWRSLNISQVIRSKQGFLLLASLVLSSFQKRVGADIGIAPGEEMVAAIKKSDELKIPITLADRPVNVTLRRAWRLSSYWNRMKMLSSLITSVIYTEKIEADQIEELKKRDSMHNMMEELGSYLPSVKKVLIDERDRFLAIKIFQAEGKRSLAVIGAGHLEGVIKTIKEFDSSSADNDIEELSKIPSAKLFDRAIPWAIPAAVIAIIITGFLKGEGIGEEILRIWVLRNSIPSFLGALVAAAHPLTLIVAAVAAPFTSLNPAIGAGIVAALTESALRKPKVEDMENLSDDLNSLKKWYKNRILKIILILLLVSLGSFVGGLSALPSILGKAIG